MLASLLMVLCLQMAAQTWEDVKVGTSTRKTLTYVPKNVEKSPALVISLHGMNQDPGFQQNQTQWNALADTWKRHQQKWRPSQRPQPGSALSGT